MKRKVLRIRRLSFGTLYKICYLGCLGFVVPFCSLAFTISFLAPDRVRLAPGMTMGGFYFILLAGVVAWPILFAFFCACASWVALTAKSLISDTTIEVVESTRGEISEQEPNQPVAPAR